MQKMHAGCKGLEDIVKEGRAGLQHSGAALQVAALSIRSENNYPSCVAAFE